MAKPIALAADHGGFELKEAVKAHLKELGLEYIDFGTHSTASVDTGAQRVSRGKASPLTAASPMRSPVKLPGPALTP